MGAGGMMERDVQLVPMESAQAAANNDVKRPRILVAVWACAYEVMSFSMVPDARFDEMCHRVQSQLAMGTDRPDLDAWFRSEFQPHTGQWVWKHPELSRLKQICGFYRGKT